jgi:hypothetical protein
MHLNSIKVLAFSFLLSLNSKAQIISGFENLPMDSSGYNAGSINSSGFEDGGLLFRNDYNPDFQSWNGFALSRKTDSLTAGYMNQFSCRPGLAWEGSNFMLAYASSRIFVRRLPSTPARRLLRFRLANNTYAARSMQYGDPFAKKFGGNSGMDPDFFKLSVYNYLDGSITDSASYYLADYRAEGSANDYILSSWMDANPAFADAFDSLGFELSSSDVGSFGMNTPAYFCIDNLETENSSSTKNEMLKTSFRLFPNPCSGHFFLETTAKSDWQLIDLLGRVVRSGHTSAGKCRILIAGVKPGFYLFRNEDGESSRLQIQ